MIALIFLLFVDILVRIKITIDHQRPHFDTLCRTQGLLFGGPVNINRKDMTTPRRSLGGRGSGPLRADHPHVIFDGDFSAKRLGDLLQPCEDIVGHMALRQGGPAALRDAAPEA